MIPFQYAGIFLCAVFAGWCIRKVSRRDRPGWLWLLGVLVASAAAVAIYDPDITTHVAKRVGIQRGADLLIYIVALAFLGSWFYFYHKLRTLSNAVTVLVRELAIRDPRAPSPRVGDEDGGRIHHG